MNYWDCIFSSSNFLVIFWKELWKHQQEKTHESLSKSACCLSLRNQTHTHQVLHWCQNLGGGIRESQWASVTRSQTLKLLLRSRLRIDSHSRSCCNPQDISLWPLPPSITWHFEEGEGSAHLTTSMQIRFLCNKCFHHGFDQVRDTDGQIIQPEIAITNLYFSIIKAQLYWVLHGTHTKEETTQLLDPKSHREVFFACR